MPGTSPGAASPGASAAAAIRVRGGFRFLRGHVLGRVVEFPHDRFQVKLLEFVLIVHIFSSGLCHALAQGFVQ